MIQEHKTLKNTKTQHKTQEYKTDLIKPQKRWQRNKPKRTGNGGEIRDQRDQRKGQRVNEMVQKDVSLRKKSG